jgi:hypothetical protein
MATCKGCGKEIKWITMATGAKMPVDEMPQKMIQIKENIGESITVFMPHWATCSKADNFRKEKG